MKRLFVLLAATALAAPAIFAQAAPKPTPEQLAKVYEEDQLSLEACGVPRNAADDYRPTPLTPDQTRAHRLPTSDNFKLDVVASGLPNPWALAFLPSGNMLVTIRGEGLRVVSADGNTSSPVTGTPPIKNAIRLLRHARRHASTVTSPATALFTSPYVTTPEGKPMTGSIVQCAKLSADEQVASRTTPSSRNGPGMIPRRIVQAHGFGRLFIQTADSHHPLCQRPEPWRARKARCCASTPTAPIPGSNPFVPAEGDRRSRDLVYAYGFRDPQGMTLRSQPRASSGLIENEPRGGDELNVVQAGKQLRLPADLLWARQ